MAKSVKRPSGKIGLMPGSLVYVGDRSAGSVRVSRMTYHPDAMEEDTISSFDSLAAPAADGATSWINVEGMHDVDVVRRIGDALGLHPLVLEDILNTEHRPKAEDHGSYLFFTLKIMYRDEAGGDLDAEQISFVLTKTSIISFQERPGDIFDPIRERIRSGKGRVRGKGADYLVFLLVDAVVDHYYPVIEQLHSRIERIEDEVLRDPGTECLAEIQRVRKKLILMRKTVQPLREAVAFIEKCGSPLIRKETVNYIRNVYDHTVHLAENIETGRDLLASVKDMYLTSLSNRMNTIMKVLTVMASIFIPLTFIAGVYGMNFDHMPELHFRYGYFAVWGIMAAVAAALIAWFRFKKWI